MKKRNIKCNPYDLDIILDEEEDVDFDNEQIQSNLNHSSSISSCNIISKQNKSFQ